MKKLIAAAEQKKLHVNVADGSCRIGLPCSEWMLLRKIDGYTQFHLTASKGVVDVLTKTYDLQPTKAGYYLIDEETAAGFVAMLSDHVVDRAVKRYQNDIADFASHLKSMESTEQRSEGVKRVGQDKLRQLLLASIGACEISGIHNKDLLVASHIKPWGDCVDGGSERLDPENVLLLAANWDALFDKKYISFDPETGRMIKSKRITEETLWKFGVPRDWKVSVCIPVHADQRKEYLKWHNRMMEEEDKKASASRV